MVNHTPPIRYFVAISRPKPCPLLWEKKLKRIPSGIQTHTPSILKSITSWEELNLQRFAQLDTPQWERVYPFRHGKRSFFTTLKGRSQRFEESFSKAIYHVLDNTGQLLPSCFFQRHERVLLIYARTQGCSRPIAGQVPLLSEGVFAYTIEHFALPLIQN